MVVSGAGHVAAPTGAVDMANLVPDRAAHQELKDLAQGIIQSQSGEITTMNAWLSSWYGL